MSSEGRVTLSGWGQLAQRDRSVPICPPSVNARKVSVIGSGVEYLDLFTPNPQISVFIVAVSLSLTSF